VAEGTLSAVDPVVPVCHDEGSPVVVTVVVIGDPAFPGSGAVQFPDSQLPLPQKTSPVPQTPSKLQQFPHLPPHKRFPFLGPHLPSSEYSLAPGQAPS
jgi:hypothetical protein